MSPEPAELQILRQTLGHELGSMVFSLNLMAGTLAQHAQQLQQQGEALQQMQAPPTPDPPATSAPSENPWTGPDTVPREGP